MHQRILVVVLAFIIGLISALGVPALLVQSSKLSAAPMAQLSDGRVLLRQGIEHYESERFADAVAVWQQALPLFIAQTDRLTQALLLSNLSLAYQHLGRWSEAETAIRSSLELLKHPLNRQDYFEILAKAWNAQGRLQWATGRTEIALEAWRQATNHYAQANQLNGVVGSLINQAEALQVLGLSVQAERSLERVEQLLAQQTDLKLKSTGLRSLGNALRRLGSLTRSQQVLQASVLLARRISAESGKVLQGAALLELGNTERALGERSSTISQQDKAASYRRNALNHYQQAAKLATSAILQAQAQLNQLSLLVETQNWATATTQVPAIQRQIQRLPINRTAIDSRLNLAQSLLELRSQGFYSPLEVAQFLATVVQQARDLRDVRAESVALGQLGKLYKLNQQWADAQTLTQQALLLAEAPQNLDIRYRWEWQLGRLLKTQGKLEGAIAAYQTAIETLESVRSDLLFINADIQFSFRENVEPVYREFVDLLLRSNRAREPSQAELQQAIRKIDALQLSELENFLRCNLAQVVEVGQVKDDPTAAILYPIILENRLSIILEVPGKEQLVFRQTLVSQQEVEKTLQELYQNLSEAKNRTPQVIPQAQKVYQWLIQPFESVLASQQIQTLVFVLDGSLRNIPMAVLHDGNQYLIQKYAIALAPRLQLFSPQPLPQDLTVFTGGIGKQQTIADTTFEPIQLLQDELKGIGQHVRTQQPLLETDFTKVNLERQLSQGGFSAVHLKTHGQFSADPEETFIVAYQELIKGRELGELIRSSNQDAIKLIELLVLSACSTAQGDDRAVLGMAGIAIQAGARSTLSTLWNAQDEPNTQLMIRFYQELRQPQATRAQALQRAQLYLLERGYAAPHFWAPYVLVGNWL